MSRNQKQSQKGFTIIEVVLVLAIAGLIFMMVFIALPALQRSQRDTQRKNDLSKALTQLESYTSNENGSVPVSQAEWINFKTNYLVISGESFEDPSTGDTYAVAADPGNSGTLKVGTIYYTNGATCDGSALSTGQSSRKVALRMKLESGLTCENN